MPIPRHRRILVVEDDANTLFLVRSILQKHFSVTTATEPKTALDILRYVHHDLVLTDLHFGHAMPTGIHLLESIRTIDAYESLPVIAMSGYASYGDPDRLMSLGFAGYISKPFARQDLLKALAVSPGG
ncbi:MAG: response regulator [Bacteroidota bacterium]